MIEPSIPANEKERQAAVEKYDLLDTLPEEEYDNITSLMSYICDCPISLITLLDKERNFLKSHHGIPFDESPRKISFCGHAINSPSPITIIEDARTDERFFDNPLVTEMNAIFYAGVPLVDDNGFKLGTLCVYDIKPRKLKIEQQNALIAMAKQVVKLFEERYKNIQLTRMHSILNDRNQNLKDFANIVSHDLKSPLSNIIGLTQLLELENKDKFEATSQEYLTLLKQSSKSLKNYIDGLLQFYKADELLKLKAEAIDIKKLLQELKNTMVIDSSIQFDYSSNSDILLINKSALMQILINLVTNGLKYNHKQERSIFINVSEEEHTYKFEVKDNGDGIPTNNMDTLFELFSKGENKDRDGYGGSGIGLATARKMVEYLGGTIEVISKEKIGTTFVFTVGK